MKSIVSEKGQVTIPKRIRDRLGLKPGQALVFEAQGGKLVATKAPVASPVDAVYGMLKSRRTTGQWLRSLRGHPETRR